MPPLVLGRVDYLDGDESWIIALFPQIVLVLQVQPELGRRVGKGDGQPHRHEWADTRFAVDEFRQRLAADAQHARRLGNAESKRFDAVKLTVNCPEVQYRR